MQIFRIAAAAKALGVSPGTLRELEKRGLFRIPRDWSGQRILTADKIEQVREAIFPDLKKRAGSERRS